MGYWFNTLTLVLMKLQHFKASKFQFFLTRADKNIFKLLRCAVKTSQQIFYFNATWKDFAVWAKMESDTYLLNQSTTIVNNSSAINDQHVQTLARSYLSYKIGKTSVVRYFISLFLHILAVPNQLLMRLLVPCFVYFQPMLLTTHISQWW